MLLLIDKLRKEVMEKQYLLDLMESNQVMDKLTFQDMQVYKQRQRDSYYYLAEVRFKIRNWDKESRIRVSLGNTDKVDPNDPEVQYEAVREAKKLWKKKISKIYPDFLDL
jgi:hypothetical protein